MEWGAILIVNLRYTTAKSDNFRSRSGSFPVYVLAVRPRPVKINNMQESTADRLESAERIVSAYGAVLARLKHVNTALPNSLLPYPKAEIKQAIQTLLWEFDEVDHSVRNSLIQAYVYLEQFITDNKVEIVARGQAAIQSADPEHPDWRYADEANRIITQIKMDMEDAMQDMRIYLDSTNDKTSPGDTTMI
jgi:hypothetical protein